MKLESLVQYLDDYLRVQDVPDYANAVNGLQVGGRDEVSTIVTAVDASEASIRAAVHAGAELLLVHHGLFWGGVEPIVGRHFRRIEALISGGTALYSCHLPLDAHSEIGNSALLASCLDVDIAGGLGEYKGAQVGCWGTLTEPLGPAALRDRLCRALGSPVTAIPGGPERIETIGVVTGGGGSFIREAAERGLHAFVTGEGSHQHYFDATELGIHVFLGGHYATETFGVRALGEHVAERFGLSCSFIDQPTGL